MRFFLPWRQLACLSDPAVVSPGTMPSNRETFWEHGAFAVVGHAAKQSFPRLTYRGLKNLGKTVFAVDASVGEIDGDPAYDDLKSLPASVDAVVLEVPKEETESWVLKAADAGIKDVWIHMNRETPEALAAAKERDLNVRYGTCAVMYVTPGFTYHALHRWMMKLVKKY